MHRLVSTPPAAGVIGAKLPSASSSPSRQRSATSSAAHRSSRPQAALGRTIACGASLVRVTLVYPAIAHGRGRSGSFPALGNRLPSLEIDVGVVDESIIGVNIARGAMSGDLPIPVASDRDEGAWSCATGLLHELKAGGPVPFRLRSGDGRPRARRNEPHLLHFSLIQEPLVDITDATSRREIVERIAARARITARCVHGELASTPR